MAKATPANDFLITGPLDQHGVVPEVPDGVEMVDLDDVPYRAEPQVHCAFCKQRQLHNDGYFAILSNGQRAPCGNCCAANFDSVKKKTIDKRRVRLKRERENQQRAWSVADGIDKLDSIVPTLDKPLSLTTSLALTLKLVLPDEARTDLAAHDIRGLSILDGCDAKLGYAAATFRRIRQEATNGITKAQHEKMADERRQAIEELVNAIGYLNTCRQFFDAHNLAAIGKWVATDGIRFGVKQFEMKNGRLHMKGPGHWQNIDVPNLTPPTVIEVQALAQRGDGPTA